MQSDVTQEMTIIDNDIVTKIITIKQQPHNEMLEKTQGFYQILTHLSYNQGNCPWGKKCYHPIHWKGDDVLVELVKSVRLVVFKTTEYICNPLRTKRMLKNNLFFCV